MAPSPGTPSMTGTLEKYVAEVNKRKIIIFQHSKTPNSERVWGF